jgi:fatty acyl-CoA reductase
LQIFDWLRKERPEALNKVVPVCGDITLHELGISPADQKILADSVSVVFHSAATVKFDEALKLSVGMNIMGTKRIVQLCHKMVKLEVSAVRFRLPLRGHSLNYSGTKYWF